ncbi:MAG TPA: sugar phosphate nucleotidyltransferase [Bryobacteraceae bacterium]|nr:sugar phosphate nucleotidyltransferase [Bryobacteraceae bacterium]
MQISKAVITAAGENQRRLPLQILVDLDGQKRTVLSILLREILDAKIKEICVVLRPGDEAAFREAAPEYEAVLRFVVQAEPRGYGDAIWCAREFTHDEPFLHLVGDHLYIPGQSGATHLLELARKEACSVSAVRATHESLLSSFGAVGGQPVSQYPGLFEVETVLEKPTPTVAEQRIIVPGLRAGHYLTFFGLHVLTSSVMDILGRLKSEDPKRRVTLSDALAILPTQERYLALQLNFERFDLGDPYGLLSSQLALALSGHDRDKILSLLVGMLAGEPGRAREAARG